jgi:hypothetical protein
MIELNLTSFLISWFVVGLICVAVICVSDMRDKEFDPDYFDGPTVFIFILLITFGYISIFITYYLFASEKKYFTRLIYKICNIGVKRTNKNRVLRGD